MEELRDKQTTNAWSSPSFLKSRRLQEIPPINNDFDPFLDADDDWEADRHPKKVKFGRKSDQWRFVKRSSSPDKVGVAAPEGRAPSPTAETLDAQISSIPIADLASAGKIATRADSEGKLVNSLPQTQEAPVSSGSTIPTDQSAGRRASPDVILQKTVLESNESTQISYPVLDIFDNVAETVLDRSVEALQDSFPHEPDIRGDEPQSNLNANSIIQSLPVPTEQRNIPRNRRSPSRTPEPNLRIEIRSATPLPDVSNDSQQPLTPRLQPLPSPGLMIVSPLEQRQFQRSEYLEPAADTDQASCLPQEPQNTDSAVVDDIQSDKNDESHQSDAVIGNIHPGTDSNDLEIGENVDTFFGKLLAHYDQGTIEETGAISSHDDDPPEEPLVSEIELLDEIDTQASEPPEELQIDHDRTSNFGSVEDENRDILASIAQDSEQAEISHEPESDESDESEDDNSMKHGKQRDMTYEPSHEEAGPAESQPESILLIDYLKPQDIKSGSVAEQQTSELSRPSLSPSLSTPSPKVRMVQDTYYSHDELDRGTSPPMEIENNHTVEVIDLLDSASSSPEPEKSPQPEVGTMSPLATQESMVDEDQQDIHGEKDARNMISPVVEEEINSGSQYREESLLSQDEEEAESENHDHINTESQEEYFTAPSKMLNKLEVEEASDLTSIPEDEALIETTETPIDGQSLALPSVKPNKQNRAPTKPRPAQQSQTAEQEIGSSRRITRSQSQQQAESETSKEVVVSPADMTTTQNQPQEKSQGFRTTYDYYSTLPTLAESYNNNTSVLAVVVASSNPIRATTGPRDFNQTLYLASPYPKIHSDFTIAQLFRPYSSALPHPIPSGAVILLKEFKVQSFQRKMSLLSTETSAWAVFDHALSTNQSNMEVSTPGPPLEFGAAERGVAWGLGKWWTTLNKQAKTKIEDSAIKARDKAQSELEKRAVALASKSSSQTHTPIRHRPQTRSTQNQPLLQSSIPNTPTTSSPPINPYTRTNKSTTPTTPTPSHRRTRSNQHPPSTPPPAAAAAAAAKSSPTPTPTARPSRPNTRSSPLIPESQLNSQSQQTQGTGHELRSGVVYSDNEFESGPDVTKILNLGIPTTGSVSSSGIGARVGRRRRRTRSERRDEGKRGGKGGEGDGGLHELRDGVVYRD